MEKDRTAYEKNSAACHGADEKGNPVFAKTLGEKELNIVGKETKQKSDEALLKVSLKARARCRRTRSIPKMNKRRCGVQPFSGEIVWSVSSQHDDDKHAQVPKPAA